MADENLPDINGDDVADDNVGPSLGAAIIAGSEDGALMDVSIRRQFSELLSSKLARSCN